MVNRKQDKKATRKTRIGEGIEDGGAEDAEDDLHVLVDWHHGPTFAIGSVCTEQSVSISIKNVLTVFGVLSAQVLRHWSKAEA